MMAMVKDINDPCAFWRVFRKSGYRFCFAIKFTQFAWTYLRKNTRKPESSALAGGDGRLRRKRKSWLLLLLLQLLSRGGLLRQPCAPRLPAPPLLGALR